MGYKSTIIYELVANGAAKAAGLQKGDIIMNVDNKSTVNVALKNVVAMIRGEEGTTVKLVVDRNGSILTYNIVRKKFTNASANAASITPSGTTEKSSYELEFDEFLNDEKSAAPAEEKKPVKTNSNYELDFSGFNLNSSQSAVSIPSETVTIGSQTWMKKNLDVTTFRNGDLIAEAKTYAEWENAYKARKPAWCYYNFDPANGVIYGKLYNVYAVTNAKGLAPSGWHIPSKVEYDKLITALPDNAVTGTKLKNIGEGGYAFVQGGYKSQDGFIDSGKRGVWWTSTQKTIFGAWVSSANDGAYAFSLYSNQNRFYDFAYSIEGLSVRCVKD